MQSTPTEDAKEIRPVRTSTFWLLAIVVGLVAGLGAVVFRGMIALIHNFLFLGKVSVFYDASTHTPESSLGPLVILVPVIGAMGVAFLVKNFAPEAKGHGVPEVMDAIHYHGGRMRPIVGVIKSLASALSIGSGGSVGREGPIVQIGSAFSATVGELLHLPGWQRITLIAGGAGGGIAATFNTPVGGVLFAVELMLHEVSARTLVPVAISTVAATYVAQMIFGPHPAFVIPAFETPYFHVESPFVLLAYAGLGILTGLASALFIRALYGFESLFERRIGGGYYRQHAIGMFLVGLMMYAMMIASGHYYVEGVGYATIQDLLSGVHISLFLLALLFVLKLLATCLTLGSGASGGIFSPCLFMGATLGGAYGTLVNYLVPSLAISPAAFGVVGMAGVVGGSTAAATTAIVMIFEMTLDYRVIVPMTLTVAVSYGIRRALVRESIYTRKLVLRGHQIPEALQANVYLYRTASSLMDTRIETVPASMGIEEFRRHSGADQETNWFLVTDHNGVIGVVPKDCQGEVGATLGEIARRDLCRLPEGTPLNKVCTIMHRNNATYALVVATTDKVEGLITKPEIADAVAEAAEAFGDEQ